MNGRESGLEALGGAGVSAATHNTRPPVRRVLMTADGVGGVWQYATDLSAALAGRGIDVLLAVMGPPLAPDQRADAATRGLRVVEGPYRLEWMNDPWDDIAAAGAWLLEIERAFSPDVVHVNGYCHAALPWMAPVMLVGHSCVRSWWRAVHGAAAPPAWNRYAHAVAQGLRAAQLVVTPTETMLNALRDEYGCVGDALVIPNARASVADTPIDPVAKERMIFAAGRLWDRAKNIEALFEIAPGLAWPVFVAGDGDGAGVQPALGNGPLCRLGRLPADAMAGWYGRSAIYALPARYEPFGLSVLEAAAAGCALVLGDIQSLRENWTGAALFVPPEDRRALAAAITGLIADPARRAAFARRALFRSRQFTVARMAGAYVGAYEAVLKMGTRSLAPSE